MLIEGGFAILASNLLNTIRNFGSKVDNSIAFNGIPGNVNNKKDLVKHTRSVPAVEITENIELDLLELIRLRKADLKNPLIGYLKINHFECVNF